MLVPRAVRLKCKTVPLQNPQVDNDAFLQSLPTQPDQGRPKSVFGNYKNYYAYRKEDGGDGSRHDARISILRKEWFFGKRCLDIGCNTGALSFELGRTFGYKSMLGVDIDSALILKADTLRKKVIEKHPERPEDAFPNNLSFRTENFLEATHTDAYDTIVCFSVTKWIHLNWGDAGLRRFFGKINDCLRPGGLLLLEPQPFSSYKRRSHLTPEIRANYKAIKMMPQHFPGFLAVEFGFERLVAEDVAHSKKGFARSIQVYRKPVVPWVKEKEWTPPVVVAKSADVNEVEANEAASDEERAADGKRQHKEEKRKRIRRKKEKKEGSSEATKAVEKEEEKEKEEETNQDQENECKKEQRLVVPAAAESVAEANKEGNEKKRKKRDE